MAQHRILDYLIIRVNTFLSLNRRGLGFEGDGS